MISNRDKLVTQVKVLKQLGYCRAVVADMMGIKERKLDSHLLPESSKQYRTCPKIVVNMAQRLINEHSPKKAPVSTSRYQG